MRNIWVIAQREYRHYFSSPIAYVLLFFILLVLGLFFYLNLSVAMSQQGYVPGVANTLFPLATMMMLITPALTSRLLAEERRLGTIELLLTAPVRDWELVVGKWLGAWLMLLTIVVISLIYPLVLNQLIDPGIDQGPVLTGYLGMALFAAALSAIGVFVSSLFSNQIATFITTLGVMIFLWWVIGPITQVLGAYGGGSELLRYLDMNYHLSGNFINGVIDLRDVVYMLSITALGLFMASASVEIRRWG